MQLEKKRKLSIRKEMQNGKCIVSTSGHSDKAYLGIEEGDF